MRRHRACVSLIGQGHWGNSRARNILAELIHYSLGRLYPKLKELLGDWEQHTPKGMDNAN